MNQLSGQLRSNVSPSNFTRFRKLFPHFTFDSYSICETSDAVTIDYSFEISELKKFSPRWTFPKSDCSEIELKENATFRSLIFSLGLVELISYWKTTCSPQVTINAGSLTPAQIKWWKKLYFNGLGEFFYKNNIHTSTSSFMHIASTGKGESNFANKSENARGCLIPVGGGKDSIVTLDLLKRQSDRNYCYCINPTKAAIDIVGAFGYHDEHFLKATRTLDKNMLELNAQGFLNGHTPFSAIVAFSSVIMAYMHGIRYVALSNESSANESTLPNSKVNHQYSKSFEFENDFHSYEKEFLKSGVYYFSLLRPLSELQISEYFSKLSDCHHLFRSCNAGSKQNLWCCKCPKCLFVFIILSPFISQKRLKEIFGSNLLNNVNLKDIFEQLIGIREEKPFECVGSRAEINISICMSILNLLSAASRLPFLFNYYKSTYLYKKYRDETFDFKKFYDHTNLLPPNFKDLISREFSQSNYFHEV